MRTRSGKDHGVGVSQKNVDGSNPSPASTLDDVVAQLASVNAILQQIAQPATSVQHGRYDSDVAVLYKEFLTRRPGTVFQLHALSSADLAGEPRSTLQLLRVVDFLDPQPLFRPRRARDVIVKLLAACLAVPDTQQAVVLGILSPCGSLASSAFRVLEQSTQKK
uniref:Uncharacterized protein n=1 Tax=Zea mays TaxID=4577 RepID=A0A804PAG0_MAIZE